MSTHTGFTVRSEFFSNTGDDLNGHRSSRSRSGNIFTKGSDSSTGSDRVVVNLQVLKNEISELKKYANVRVSELPTKISEKLSTIGKLAGLLRDTSSYDSIIKSVEEAFGNQTVNPGTVASFFYGCFSPSNYDGILHCSATCAGNLPLPNIAGWQDCDKTVILLSKDGLDVRHAVDGDEAIIHYIDDEYKGFSRQQIKELKDLGIKYVTVDLFADGHYTLQCKSLPIDELPLISEVSYSTSFSKTSTASANRENTIGSNASNPDKNVGNHQSQGQGRQSNASGNPRKSKSSHYPDEHGFSSSFDDDTSISEGGANYSIHYRGGKNYGNEGGWGWIIAIIIIIIIVIFIAGAWMRFGGGGGWMNNSYQGFNSAHGHNHGIGGYEIQTQSLGETSCGGHDFWP